MLSFQTLLIVMLAGVCGPLLSGASNGLVPVIVGELAAGALLGASGLKVLNPAQPTFAFLADGGFLMLMFAAGMHVPVDSLRRALGPGTAGALLSLMIALPTAGVIHLLLGGPALVYALLMANSSAAVILPLVQERHLDQDAIAVCLAHVTIADVLTIITLPLVLHPSAVASSTLGAVAVLAAIGALALLARVLHGHEWVEELRASSRKQGWALELRVSLIGVVALASIAERTGVSLLIAGFFGGLLLAALGGPKRLSKQVTALAQGFLVPIFFVSLGARLNVLAVFSHPQLLALTLALIAAAAFVHVSGGIVMREGIYGGMLGTAQLGLPAAVAALGLKAGALSSGQAAAVVLAGLGTIAFSVVAAARLLVQEQQAALERQLAGLRVRFRSSPSAQDLASAHALLCETMGPEHAEAAVQQLRKRSSVRPVKAAEVLAAAQIAPLGADSSPVKGWLSRLADGKKLPPVLLIARHGQPPIIAEGLARASASLLIDRDAELLVCEAQLP